MSRPRRTIIWKAILLFELLMLLYLLALPTLVFADHCLEDPLNAADCMRTPGFREALTTVLIGR
jgi:hypothetical protein